MYSEIYVKWKESTVGILNEIFAGRQFHFLSEWNKINREAERNSKLMCTFVNLK